MNHETLIEQQALEIAKDVAEAHEIAMRIAETNAMQHEFIKRKGLLMEYLAFMSKAKGR